MQKKTLETKNNLSSCRFYGILDTGYTPLELWEEKCNDLATGGAGIIQVRAKNKTHFERVTLVGKAYPICKKHNIPLIVNDDIECALQFPEAGLHIGQDDIPPKEARNILGPERILGLSTHSAEQAQQAIAIQELLDYFAIGPIFTTQTKPDYIPVGLQLVKEVSAMNPPLPFFCIGGIHRKNVQSVINHGASAVVAVSDVLCDDNTAQATQDYIKQFQLT